MKYEDLEKFLSKKIDNAKVEIVGKSELERSIYSVEFNFNSKHTFLIQGAIHAREHITSDLICLMIKDVSINYEKYKKLNSPNIIFVPMVNPDGVMLCYNGLKSVRNKIIKTKLLKINNNSKDFSLFKANVNGVDLNTNFDAKWGSGKDNKFKPSSSDYVGCCPMSEKETKCLALLTINKKVDFSISYHSKGEEIYYNFYNKKENLKRDYCIAKIIAKTTRYKIKNVENVSAGGYKDWCVYRLNIPAVTIEVGKDSFSHPIKIDKLKQIYSRNKNIIKKLNKITREIERNEQRINENCIKRGK